ncbi:hypothetical protein FZC66_02915 [Priestia megaterium]|nr:hypothetical protein FZC66_02915 [Priestia megaterium]
MKRWFNLLIGWSSSYYFSILPLFDGAFTFAEFIVRAVLNPVQSFLIICLFVLAFSCQSVWVRIVIEEGYRLYKKVSVNWKDIMFAVAAIAGLCALSTLGFYQVVSICVFSIIYGVFSANIYR